jgi:hypothetical protein
LHSNPVSHSAAGAVEVALRSAEDPAEASYAEPARRFSPLASLIVVALLSLGSWAAIWAAATSLLAK